MSRRLVGVLLLPNGAPEVGELWFEGGGGVVRELLAVDGSYDISLSSGEYLVTRVFENSRIPLGKIQISAGADTTLNERLIV